MAKKTVEYSAMEIFSTLKKNGVTLFTGKWMKVEVVIILSYIYLRKSKTVHFISLTVPVFPI